MENYFYLKLEVFFYLESKVKILTNYLDSIRKKILHFYIIQNLPAFYLNIKSILNCFFSKLMDHFGIVAAYLVNDVIPSKQMSSLK